MYYTCILYIIHFYRLLYIYIYIIYFVLFFYGGWPYLNGHLPYIKRILELVAPSCLNMSPVVNHGDSVYDNFVIDFEPPQSGPVYFSGLEQRPRVLDRLLAWCTYVIHYIIFQESPEVRIPIILGSPTGLSTAQGFAQAQVQNEWGYRGGYGGGYRGDIGRDIRRPLWGHQGCVICSVCPVSFLLSSPWAGRTPQYASYSPPRTNKAPGRPSVQGVSD